MNTRLLIFDSWTAPVLWSKWKTTSIPPILSYPRTHGKILKRHGSRIIRTLCLLCVITLWNLLANHTATSLTSTSLCHAEAGDVGKPVIAAEFLSPPDAARPWVYWVIMDGNLTREGITADFEAMRDQGIGGFIMMEVNNGVPRGPVDFMSETWQELFVHVVREAERCGLQMTLLSGPGWAGSGGPWITPELSMWHLVAAERNVRGPVAMDEMLPTPQPRTPFFGEGTLPPNQEKARKEFFRDVCVLAFPTPAGHAMIENIDEKADYIRAPYSSAPGVKPRLPAPAHFPELPANQTIDPSQIRDITEYMDTDGRLTWNIPEGEWTILRFAAASTGANTRPAPAPGMGLESSKMDRDAFDIHIANYTEKLLKAVGKRQTDGKAGWCCVHIDSWEMGPQNYSPIFLREFAKRRGYDPYPWLPAYTGRVVQSVEQTERFLWDVRQTAQELILENYVGYLRDVARQHGLQLSLEFYDMMPCCDMTFGAVADVPMCEFWANTFDTVFSCWEAASIAHTHGKPIVGAEAFTSGGDQWQNNPKSMKLRTDWAFCAGINRLTFHRYQHQPYLDKYPGFSMGHYGSHWERTQTWWPLSLGYHTYLSRCQHLLRQGNAVVDLLYLVPEGAPQVFTPPRSALSGDGTLRDQRGYRFDGCDPGTFVKLATVENGEIVFPNATRYRLLVLPKIDTMTLPLLEKIDQLIQNGAVVIGTLPYKSPSLEGYPQVDECIQTLAAKIRGDAEGSKDAALAGLRMRRYGKGTIYLIEPSEKNSVKPLTLDGTKWIWFPEGEPAWDAPEGARYFRKTFTLENDVCICSARLLAAADNDVSVQVNGVELYRANLSEPIREVDFTKYLRAGVNQCDITAINGPNTARNPAGLLAVFEIVAEDAAGNQKILRIPTDATWQTSRQVAWNGEIQSAVELGDYGIGPWGSRGIVDRTDSTEIYPTYEQTVAILARQKIPEDFTSRNDALRFFHRRDGTTDYYFVSNRLEIPYDDEVTFRVTGKHASVMEPMTGRVFRMPPCTEVDGITRVRLALESEESVFVVFSDAGTQNGTEGTADQRVNETSKMPVWRKMELRPMMELSDNWSVRFDPRFAGPDQAVHFDQLVDWTTREEPAIRYYSGMVEYERKFNYDQKNTDDRLFLDLGEVEVMAEVRINGELAGIRWVSPYRMEITDLLRNGENTISIRVVNLWSNRLIGDAALPESERVTWSTWPNGGYTPHSPLLPSGLIGPVRILRETGVENE